MTASITAAILPVVEDYLAATKASPAALGLCSVNDASLVFDMRAGRNIRHSTADRLLEYMMARLEGLIAASARRQVETDLTDHFEMLAA